MVDDVLAVVEEAGAHSIVPIAHAHGGWVAVELLRRLGERVSKLVLISWNPIITSTNPAAAPLLSAAQGLQSEALWGALQDEAGWKDAVGRLVDTWVKDAPADVDAQIRDETGAHGFDDWPRAGREITIANESVRSTPGQRRRSCAPCSTKPTSNGATCRIRSSAASRDVAT